MKTTQVLSPLFSILLLVVSFEARSQQTQSICGDVIPEGWVTTSINGMCGGGATSRIITRVETMSPGSTLTICGDPAPPGWVTTSVNGTCPSNGINYVNRTIIKVEGYTAVSEMGICGDPAPPGWITKSVNGYCTTVDGISYESRTITRISNLPNGTEVSTCGDLPPSGWITKSVNGNCPSNGINYISRTIKRIDGMAAGTEEYTCGDLPPTGWITLEVSSNCGYNSTYVYRKIKKIDGLPSETKLEVCGDLPPPGWVTLIIRGNCGLNSAYVARQIQKVTCMPVNTELDICGDTSYPEGWVLLYENGYCYYPYTAKKIKKLSGYPTAITISGPQNTNICSGTSATLSASSCPGGTINWSNGSQGASITVFPTTTTNYTATCSQGECTSPNSNTITITVTSVDVQVQPGASACVGKSATLSASGCSGNYQWYASNTSSTVLSYSSVYTTPALNNNTTYYVNCVSGNCTSARKSITVTITYPPNTPNSTGQTICAGKTATLTASGCAGTYKWYSSNTSTTVLASAASYTTPILNNNTSYYVSCTITCESERRETPVTIGPSPSAPAANASGTAICNGQSVTLTATGCTGTVTWSNGQSGTAIAVNTTGTYAAKCTVNSCQSLNSNVLTITSGVSGAPDNLSLTGTSTAGVRTANKTITSTQVIPNGVNTTYNAGNNIILNPPFNAANGSIFKVEIKGCGT